MRTLHLLIGTLLLAVPGQAQPSHWPTSNASWKVFHTQAHGLVVWVSPFQLDIINGLLFTEVTYTLGNDTLLGGQQYTAVYQAWDSQFESVPGAQVDTTVNYPPQGPVFRGGFRSMGQQVYFWNVQDQSEHLLYDFDLQVGDPLPISFVYQNANATVASIDTLMLGGQARRRYHLQGAGLLGSFLVEGLGSNHGPIEPIGLGFDISDALICFGQDGHTLFPDTSTACGPPWATNVAEVEDASGLGQVYPNPFDREATLQLDPTAGTVERWVLLNSLGQVLEQGGGTRHQVRISGAGMPDGVYLLRWWNGQGLSGTVRVVKGG